MMGTSGWGIDLILNDVYIIAEAGVNHNGSIDLAKRLIDVAVQSGADAVKFQSFRADSLVCKTAEKAQYQKIATGIDQTQYEMLKKLELDFSGHVELINYCHRKKIQFLSTPFDCDSANMLDKFGMSIFKIPSGEITNLPYLRYIGRLKKEIILSTGMSDLKEVGDALGVLEAEGTPRSNITILHATTEYPCPIRDVNLNAMLTIKSMFGVKVGYSDHTSGIEVPIAAAALGACVIEKHFTLDRTMNGPDHKASLEPGELKAMVSAIRNIQQALGDGIKRPSPSELKNISIARKSIVAIRSIKKGELFCIENLGVKRPGHGISPMRWDELIGQSAWRDFEVDEQIDL